MGINKDQIKGRTQEAKGKVKVKEVVGKAKESVAKVIKRS